MGNYHCHLQFSPWEVSGSRYQTRYIGNGALSKILHESLVLRFLPEYVSDAQSVILAFPQH